MANGFVIKGIEQSYPLDLCKAALVEGRINYFMTYLKVRAYAKDYMGILPSLDNLSTILSLRKKTVRFHIEYWVSQGWVRLDESEGSPKYRLISARTILNRHAGREVDSCKMIKISNAFLFSSHPDNISRFSAFIFSAIEQDDLHGRVKRVIMQKDERNGQNVKVEVGHNIERITASSKVGKREFYSSSVCGGQLASRSVATISRYRKKVNTQDLGMSYMRNLKYVGKASALSCGLSDMNEGQLEVKGRSKKSLNLSENGKYIIINNGVFLEGVTIVKSTKKISFLVKFSQKSRNFTINNILLTDTIPY